MNDTTTRTDLTVPPRDLARLPMISAEQYQHAGRYAGAVVMSVFHQIGGPARMASWADQNPTDYFTKIFSKMISRSQQVDVSGTLTIDDAITRLERVSDIEDVDFTDIPQYDL